MSQPNLVTAVSLAASKRAEWLRAGITDVPDQHDLAEYLLKHKSYARDNEGNWKISNMAMETAVFHMSQKGSM